MLKNRLKGFIDKSNGSPDAIIFLSLFTIGFMVQIVGRLLFSVPAIIVSLVLILLLIGYAWVVKAMAYAKLSHEKASDNFYYLGFLFTVVTLAIALYKFGATENSNDDLLRNVISDLGIGLSTTIVGLFLQGRAFVFGHRFFIPFLSRDHLLDRTRPRRCYRNVRTHT